MKKGFFILILMIVSVSFLFSGGFSLFEAGSRAVGMGEAFVAVSDDLSAMFYNPAGLSYLEGTNISVGGTLIFPSTEFKGAAPYPGEGISEKAISQTFVIPNFYIGKKIGKIFYIGAGITVPFGLGVHWDDDWAGRYIATNTEIKAIDFTPTLSVKISKSFSLGISYIYRSSKLFNDQKIPFVNPWTFAVQDVAALHLETKYSHGSGFRAGTLIKLGKINFGLSYMSKITMDFTGDAKFTMISTGNKTLDYVLSSRFPATATGKTSIVFPSNLSVGFSTTAFEGLLFSFQLDYMKWSDYNELKIEFTDYPKSSTTVEKHYKNTYSFRFGAERVLSKKLTARVGYFYDQGAPELVSLGPDLPDSDKHGITFGVSFNVGKIKVDFGNIVLFFRDRSTENLNEDNFNGTYSSFAFISGINLNFNF